MSTTTKPGPPDSATARAPEARAVPSLGSSHYLSGLDGVRAIAVMSVLIGHLTYESTIDWPWLKGEWLSLTTFFTLSGFLITRLLILERGRSGGNALAEFWTRRAKRLLPALYAAMLGTMLIVLLRLTPPDKQIPGQILSALLYVKNWWYLSFHGVNGPVMFPWWSLSIEEQFYLVCPVIFVVGYRFLGKWGAAAVFTALGVASYAWAVVLSRGNHWHHVYFGTLSRVDELLAGVVLAFLVTTDRWRSIEAMRHYRLIAKVLGVVGLLTLFYLWHSQGINWLTFYKPIPFNIAATLLVIIGCAIPGGINHFLTFGPVRWIGKVSYGAYLYHVGVFHVLTPDRIHVHGTVQLAVIRIGATLALSGLSFHLLEQPLRKRRSTHRQTALQYGAASVAIAVLAYTLPLPDTLPTVTVPQALFDRTNATAPANAPELLVVGDALADSALPPLRDAMRQQPSHRVRVSTAPACPLTGAYGLALAGRAVAAQPGCRLLWFSLAAGFTQLRPDTCVLLIGAADVADLLLPDRSWTHLGEAEADTLLTRHLEQLVARAEQAGMRRLVIVVPPVRSTLATYLAIAAALREAAVAAQNTSIIPTVVKAAPAVAADTPIPPTPTAAELTRRLQRFTAIVRAVAAGHHIVEVRASPNDPAAALRPFIPGAKSGPSLLSADDWRALLAG